MRTMKRQVNMSVAIIPMAVEFGWSAADKGLISSAFFWGYTLTQIPGGLATRRFGGSAVRTNRCHVQPHLQGVCRVAAGTPETHHASVQPRNSVCVQAGRYWQCMHTPYISWSEGPNQPRGAVERWWFGYSTNPEGPRARREAWGHRRSRVRWGCGRWAPY
jgi:hypothetical protein